VLKIKDFRSGFQGYATKLNNLFDKSKCFLQEKRLKGKK
jgi:hypothetical protein